MISRAPCDSPGYSSGGSATVTLREDLTTLNKNMDTSVYPDDITKTTAGALSQAETFRFDLSDLQPAEFGGTVGQGLFKLFQDFLKDPSNVDGIAQQMEAAAKKAYG